MKKYNLQGLVTISVNTEVEADSLEETIKIAEDRELCRVHISGSSQVEEEWLCGEELDGMVQEITGEEAEL